MSPMAQAQELRPLSELTGNAAKPYPFVRCGALYQALMEWAGVDRMGEVVWQSMEKSRSQLLTVAVLLFQADGVKDDLDHLSKIVVRDARVRTY